MKGFKDIDGDNWVIPVTMRTVMTIEAETGINLGMPDIGDPPLWSRLTSDAALVSRIIWICCRPFANKHDVTEDAFYEDILIGERFEKAHRAFLENYRDFFLSRSIGGTGQRVDRALTAFLHLLDSGLMSGKSPESLASTPALSPSAN